MVPGYLWARQVLRRLRVWGPCCRQPASSRRSSGFWPPMWWRPEPCTSTNSGTLTGSCCLRGGRYGTWSSGGCFGAWVSPRAFMRCSVGCTWACALRRKMYDPQRVEGTPPSGLLLTESIKQHLAPTGVWAAPQISRLGSCSVWL